MTNEQSVAEKLLQINAIRLNVQTPFTWASGWKSPVYCDNRRILSFPYVRDFIKSELSNTVFETYPDAEVIAGVATGGIPHGALVADQLKLPFVYVRSKAKGHGLGNQVEGFLEKDRQVVVIEDLISTGKSSLEACEALQAAGARVIGLVSVFNYGFDVAKKAFETAGIPFRSLSNYETLIGLAESRGMIGAEQLATLLEWRQAPERWGK
ncbi:orotate phosphoribosyltransferase [Compostibacter hankyongensis]|uniref:Orotate phosphoribosyltransferase n=1 Tax=Compostibacter hankyongensis TaxID=1007089 RepID=A0ABP8G372_9BACT